MSENVVLGLDEFDENIRRLIALADSDKVMDALEAGAQVIVGYAQNNARTQLNKHPTGNLVNNMGVRREGNTVFAGVWGTIYAKIQEYGGTIIARNGPYLHYKVDGEWKQTKSVHIPARPYLRPAFDEHHSEIVQAVGDAMVGLMQGEIQ
jgi:HK97 gp10 family phage protein